MSPGLECNDGHRHDETRIKSILPLCSIDAESPVKSLTNVENS